MKGHEHRTIGDEATAGASVDLGRDGSDQFLLRYGDVVALSGDFFEAQPWRPDPFAPSGLFDLAAVPGDAGTVTGTQDEVVCALRVIAVDERAPDPRFDAGGEFAGYRFPTANGPGEVERRVRDRFLNLAAVNDDHFVNPGRDEYRTSRFDNARTAYRALHEAALDEAWHLGREGGDISRAMAREAAAQHYLTDAFASGHLRTPIGAIRRYWYDRYPRFWENLRLKVAADTAAALRELARPIRLVPRRTLYDRSLHGVLLRTRNYPPVSLGDLLARVFHDWDNDHGLVLERGGRLFGDGHLDEGVGRALAVAAVRAGNNDIEVAFRLGTYGKTLKGEALFSAVRDATGAGGSAYVAESRLPRPSDDNPALNWQARTIDDLWDSPIAGSRGTTVGEAVCQVLELGGEVSRRLDCLGQGVVEAFDVINVPVLGAWLGRAACHAYHRGFIENLARDPKASVLAVAHASAPVPERPAFARAS